MTKAQVERRRFMAEWNRRKRQAAVAPHGRKRAREVELRRFVTEALRAAVRA